MSEMAWIMALPKTDGVVLDIGAHTGALTGLLAENHSLCYAFEPNPRSFASLVEHHRYNPKVIPINKAVSDVDGTNQIYWPGGGGGTLNKKIIYLSAPYGGYDPEKFMLVDTIRIDTFCLGMNVATIKCDTEGGEDFLFEGAVATLSRCSPVILLEMHQTVRLDNLWNLFAKFGYDQIFDEHINDGKQPVTKFRHDTHFKLEKGNRNA